MGKMTSVLTGIAALGASTGAIAQSVVISPGTTMAVPSSNDFQAQLLGLGLDSITTSGAMLTLTGDALISFELLGSESGFDDSFGAGDVTVTETSSFTPWSTVFLGSDTFSAGSLAGILNFTSVGGVNATVGDDGFGIFWGADTPLAPAGTNVFYFGFDDQITGQDDDHDDLIIRATILPPVPEPGTWAMLLMGFGAAGFALRRSRQPLAQLA